MRSILVIGLCSVLLSSFAQELVEYATADYSLKYPKGWTLAENELGASLFIVAPKSSDADVFNEYVSLVIQDLKGTNIDLDSYVELSKQQIQKKADNVVFSTNQRLESGELKLHKMVYSGEADGLKLKLIQHYRIRDNKAYVITFAAEERMFEEFKRDGQSVLNSFRLK